MVNKVDCKSSVKGANFFALLCLVLVFVVINFPHVSSKRRVTYTDIAPGSTFPYVSDLWALYLKQKMWFAQSLLSGSECEMRKSVSSEEIDKLCLCALCRSHNF